MLSLYHYTRIGADILAIPSVKLEGIRKSITAAADIYSKQLAGKVFLYVVGEEYFEVSFQTRCFMHLTGVVSYLNAESFYNKAKTSKLTTKQFGFNASHNYVTAKKKLSCLSNLPNLTCQLVCVVKSMTTLSLVYKVGLTNLDFTIGLTEDLDSAGTKISNYLLPRTLRVKDDAVSNSADAEFVDFILSKDATSDKYETICYADPDKTIPDSLKHLISDKDK